MKKLLLLLLLVHIANAWAIQGMVTVVEAPLFKEQDIRSTIFQYANRGELLYINNKHVDRTYLTQYRPEESQGDQLYNVDESSDFYTTSDGIGRTAYILKKHVKIIYNDMREKVSSMTRTTPDETDYRLKGPLPPNYPFRDHNNSKSVFLVGVQNGDNTSYPYPQAIMGEDIGTRYQFSAEGSRRVDFDTTDRIYFGARGGMQIGQNNYLLETGYTAMETNLLLKLGPFLSYDFYKTDKTLLTLIGGISVNYHLLQITQDSDDGYRDRQLYDAFFFSPHMGIRWARREIFTDMDLVLGTELSANLPYTLQTKGTKYDKVLWNQEDDTVKQKFAIKLDSYLGLSYKF